MLILYVGKGKKYANIESALSDCTEGGTIMVSPGRYRESLKVKVPDVTIAAAKKGKVTVSSRPNEHAIDIQASHVTLLGLIVEGQSNESSELTSAIEIKGTDAIITGCKVNGDYSIGIRTFAKRTTVQDCDVNTGKGALIALKGASVSIEDSRFKSVEDTGIWLWGASWCTIEKTIVNNCGISGIWLDSAPARLKDVEVNQCNRGIVCDWPTTYPLEDDEYFGLNYLGHLLYDVRVKKSEENGLHVYPGVRVIVKECVFQDNNEKNSDDNIFAGIFFEGYTDDNEEKEEARRKRSENCDRSIVIDSKVKGNKGFGIEAEINGLVILLGQNEICENMEGDYVNVAPSGKRARVASGANNAPDTHMIRNGDIPPLVTGIPSAGSSATSRSSEDAQGDWIKVSSRYQF